MVRILGSLSSPMGPERRAGVAILVYARWVLAAASFLAVDYEPNVNRLSGLGINAVVLVAVAVNLFLHWRLYRGGPVPTSLAVAASIWDAAAITAAIGLHDGFQSTSYILYFPALLAFSLVFPGRWSVLYTGATAVVYVVVIYIAQPGFRPSDSADLKVLLLRLATMGTTAMIANIVVRIERQRRERAVRSETARTAELLVMERRALDAERTLQAERRRLSQEVHDGISQEAYMLSLGLETVAEAVRRGGGELSVGERLEALLRLAKQTLLDTRNLMFDLEGVMAGATSLVALVRHLAQEFSAVTGIPVAVRVAGEEHQLSPATVGEVYRVVQEGLANVFKHAGAGTAAIELDYGERELRLRVSDSGRGFDPERPRVRGHGLRNMRERTARLGGSLAVESAAGSGARLTVTIPYTGTDVRRFDGSDVAGQAVEAEEGMR